MPYYQQHPGHVAPDASPPDPTASPAGLATAVDDRPAGLANRPPRLLVELQAAELALAEHDAANEGPGPENSTAALLVYALGGADVGAAAGLSTLAASLLFAAQGVGLDVAAETIATAERLSTVAAELIRRERASRAAEQEAARAAAKEAARVAALPVRDPVAAAADVAQVERAADDLQALAAEVRARGIGGRRGAARALARVDAARAVLFAARAGRSSPRFHEGMRLETTLAELLAGGAS
jgi:hypothetical protein